MTRTSALETQSMIANALTDLNLDDGDSCFYFEPHNEAALARMHGTLSLCATLLPEGEAYEVLMSRGYEKSTVFGIFKSVYPSFTVRRISVEDV